MQQHGADSLLYAANDYRFAFVGKPLLFRRRLAAFGLEFPGQPDKAAGRRRDRAENVRGGFAVALPAARGEHLAAFRTLDTAAASTDFQRLIAEVCEGRAQLGLERPFIASRQG